MREGESKGVLYTVMCLVLEIVIVIASRVLGMAEPQRDRRADIDDGCHEYMAGQCSFAIVCREAGSCYVRT